MNINDSIYAANRGRGKCWQPKVVPVQRAPMRPPVRPAPKQRDYSNSIRTVGSSSHIQWRTQAGSSATTRLGSASRSRTSTEPESRIVIAVSEGRGQAIGEVGIAAIDIACPLLILCQISDSHSYVNVLRKINILNPSEILIPLTFIETTSSNRLINKIKEQFCHTRITGVARSSFNKNTGLQYAKQLCMPSMNSVLLVLQYRYYALAAAAALLTYAEMSLLISYAKESIKIEYQESEVCTMIDVGTADRLELVASARPRMKKRFSCLLDILNHCQTKIGLRTLRASILQPPCSIPDIEARLDCITELITYPNMLQTIRDKLLMMVNIDQLLTLATVLPNQAQNCSERQLNYIQLLNMILEKVSGLREVFENSSQQFFVELRETLSDPKLEEIKDIIKPLIHANVYSGKGPQSMEQRCFAIKPGINSVLDFIRKSYSERLEEMMGYVKKLATKYSLALSLGNNAKKGYHIVLSLNVHQKKTLKKTDLPVEFIQVERLSTCCTMKTQELINLSSRVEDIMLEILKMSNIMIYKLLVLIRDYVGVFYKLCEGIAKLDMLQSLAVASNAVHYVKPQFSSYLEVRHARHPLLDFLCAVTPITNSISSSEEYNMNIITGPNGSGKSIYIRQIILLQVMAQVGCYVPAKSAIFRVCDRILARIYLEDNMVLGASAFVLEMKEIQYFLTVVTKNTLIIVDELCRSTSIEEGTALAMAVCEKLMRTSAFVFYTTHFKLLAKLEDMHFNVKTWQLEALAETVNNQMVLHFTYNVLPGVTSLEHYGIFLARATWPENVVTYAEKLLQSLSNSQKRPLPHVQQVSAAARLKYDLESELKLLKAKRTLTLAIIMEKLSDYRRNLRVLGINADAQSIFNQTADQVVADDLSAILTNQEFDHGVPQMFPNLQGSDLQTSFMINFRGPYIENESRKQEVEHPLICPDYFNLNNCSRNTFSVLDYSGNAPSIFEPEVILDTTGEAVASQVCFDSSVVVNQQGNVNFYREESFMSDLDYNYGNDDTYTLCAAVQNKEHETFLISNETTEKNTNIQQENLHLETENQFFLPLIQNTQSISTTLQFDGSPNFSRKASDNALMAVKEKTINSDDYRQRQNTNKQKSDSTLSYSVRWKPPADATPPLVRSSSFKKFAQNIPSNSSAAFKTSSDSIVWGVQKITETLNAQKNAKESCYTEEDIKEILEDVQSLSGYFLETPEWGHGSNEFTLEPKHQNKEIEEKRGSSKVNDKQTDLQKKKKMRIKKVIRRRVIKMERVRRVVRCKRIKTHKIEPMVGKKCITDNNHNSDKDLSLKRNLTKEESFDGERKEDDEMDDEFIVTQEVVRRSVESGDEEANMLCGKTEENLSQTGSIKAIQNCENYSNKEQDEVLLNKHNIFDQQYHDTTISNLLNISQEKQSTSQEKISQNNLEPLGDIHLELFTDTESFIEEPQAADESRTKKSNCTSNIPYDVSSQSNSISSFLTPTVFHPLATSTPDSNAANVIGHFQKTITPKEDATLPETLIKSQSSSDLVNRDKTKSRSNKPKWRPPFKKNVKKENVRTTEMSKCKPLTKMTKKEIEQAFLEQDIKMLESGDSSQYLQQIMNRPSVRQLQQAKHVVSLQRTTSGVVMVPTHEPKCKAKKFVVPLKRQLEVDATLLSDKNSSKFEETMNQKPKKKPALQRQDVVHQFIQSETVNRPSSDGSYRAEKNLEEKDEDTPKGYYTQNKELIENLCDKYLKQQTESSDTSNADLSD